MLQQFIRMILEQESLPAVQSSGLPSNGGTTDLYHFSFAKADSLTLDPTRFGAGSYSKNDKNASSVPRTFFYVDPAEKEFHFGTGNLYMGQVSTSSIYDLTSDPQGIREEIKKRNNGMMDTDMLLQRISGWRRGAWGTPEQGKWSKGDGIADGMFYETGHFRVVVMFVPVEVHKVELEG